MVAFMLFIIGMVAYLFSQHGNDALVAEDYYEKGINYNAQQKAAQNVITAHAEPKITNNKLQLIIQLKDSAHYELKLMRPSNQKDDLVMKGLTVGDSNLILIDTKAMPVGLWMLELQWTAADRPYFFKTNITL